MTPNAWKWPALWPYTPDYFDRQDDGEDEKAYETARMAPCLEGTARESLVAHYERFLTADSEILEIGELSSAPCPAWVLCAGGDLDGAGSVVDAPLVRLLRGARAG